jgi:hypothetical protein
MPFGGVLGGLSRGGIWGSIAGGLTFTGGVMADSSLNDYYYFGGGYTLTGYGKFATTLTGSPDNVRPGWNAALTVISPTGLVGQIGWSGDIKDPSSFVEDLDYKYFQWWELGCLLRRGARLPRDIPKYLQGIDPKWLLKNSAKPESWKNWRKASISLTGFYVWDFDVLGSDNLFDRAIGMGMMSNDHPGWLGVNMRNLMMDELLKF